MTLTETYGHATVGAMANIRTKTVKVDPKRAQAWLNTQRANRPLRGRRVAYLAAVMLAGKWVLNGESIKFNGGGKMIDGQHRCAACVKSGVPFETVIVENCPGDEAFHTIDRGTTRNDADLLALRGFKNAATLSSAIRRALQWGEGLWRGSPDMLVNGPGGSRVPLGPDVIVDYAEKNPIVVRMVALVRKSGGGSIVGGAPASAMAGLGVIFAKRSSEKFAAAYISSVMFGADLGPNDPAFWIRRRLLESATRPERKLDVLSRIALVIRGWNLHCAGTKVFSGHSVALPKNWHAKTRSMPKIEKPAKKT